MARAWLRAVLAVGWFTVGCGNDPGASAAPCAPDCRAGYVCMLGVCQSPCNPMCSSTERCVGEGTTAMCVSRDGGAIPDNGLPLLDAGLGPDATAMDPDGAQATDVSVTPADRVSTDSPPPPDTGTDGAVDTSTDAAVLTDGAAPSDAPVASDRPGEMDAPTVTDGGTDTGGPAADATPPPCGHLGEPCCVTLACRGGLGCTAGMCRALASVAGECRRTADCHSGMVCAGPVACSDRQCDLCQVTPSVGRWNADCTENAQCAGGVCFRGRCSAACDLGGTGDTDCASIAPGARCAGLIYGVGAEDDAGIPATWLVFGACAPGCGRNGDCTGTRVCLPTANLLLDRLDFICGTSPRTGTAGMPCMDGRTCQSTLCVPGALPGGSGACTAPCLTDADCPAAAPACQPLTFLTPAGTGSPGHGCLPRTP